MRKISFLEWSVLIALFTISTYIYIGFWYPDPFFSDRMNPLKKYVLIGFLRLFFPVIIFGLPILFFKVKIGAIKLENVLLSLATLLIFLLLGYPVINYFYHVSFSHRKDHYHPHLQLMPTYLEIGAIQGEEVLDVVCLGGSTTEFKDSTNRGWPEKVQKELQKAHRNSTIRFHNQGKGWYTTLNSLINYQTNIRNYKPEVLVIMHGINDLLASADFSYFSHQPFRPDYGHFYGPLNRFLSHEDLIPDLTKTVSQLWYHQPRKSLSDTTFRGLGAFEQNLNTVIDLAKLDGTQVILLTQPTLYKENPSQEEQEAMFMLNYEYVGEGKRWSLETVVRGMNAYNNMVRQIATQRNVYLIDLAQSVPKTLEYFYDDCHYTQEGFKQVEKTIVEYFTRLGILKQFTQN